MHPVVVSLRHDLAAIADSQRATSMEAYMKDQFTFFGVPSRERKALIALHWKRYKEDIQRDWELISRDAWSCEEREMQYAGMDLIGKIEKRLDQSHSHHIEALITSKSWWDTVDFLASHGIGQILKSDKVFRRRKAEYYVSHENIWLRRTALIFQLFYKGETDEPLLYDLIKESLGTKEFFINKAIGWALRQYSKTNPDSVRQFLKNNSDKMASLSIREASKYIDV